VVTPVADRVWKHRQKKAEEAQDPIDVRRRRAEIELERAELKLETERQTALAQAQAESRLAALKVAKEEGTLIHVDEIIPFYDRVFTILRQTLIGVGAKLAPVVNPENPMVAQAEIDKAMHQLLEEISSGRVWEGLRKQIANEAEAEQPDQIDEDFGESEQAGYAPPEADPERVGRQVPQAEPRSQRRSRLLEHESGGAPTGDHGRSVRPEGSHDRGDDRKPGRKKRSFV
jgi:hypothetical protein